METVKISIKAHLEEYLKGKYNACKDIPVVLPDNSDLYHTIFDLMEKKPANVDETKGSLVIALPDRLIGKDPAWYNYLGERSQRIIERKIELMFWADLHDMIDHNKHIHGVEYAETVYSFMIKYDIQSITEDAVLKNYYRWREKVRRRDKKRTYNKC